MLAEWWMGYSVTVAFPLTPLPELLSLQYLQEMPAFALHALDTGLWVGRPYTGRVVQSIYTFSGPSESCHLGSCAEIISVVWAGF